MKNSKRKDPGDHFDHLSCVFAEKFSSNWKRLNFPIIKFSKIQNFPAFFSCQFFPAIFLRIVLFLASKERGSQEGRHLGPSCTSLHKCWGSARSCTSRSPELVLSWTTASTRGSSRLTLWLGHYTAECPLSHIFRGRLSFIFRHKGTCDAS